ncbi:uncharacterized protein LAJ45_01780 [Morchella importuna]|uniref:uncharacterized protein n=1 Tax=Morchella importuna TaxID=1174673 RepID=UPI001E8E58BC|nr:uncharacterized protein LAJ45_01780 [Morchella importuna]KAH8154013.1 hypothetical protein LAJ45_01780 [Morchella importuna]
MFFFPAPHRPFSEERHPPPGPPAIIVPTTRRRRAESLITINSLKVPSKDSSKGSSKASSRDSANDPSKDSLKDSSKASSKASSKLSSKAASSTQSPTIASKMSFTRSSRAPPTVNSTTSIASPAPTLDCLEIVSMTPSSTVISSYISLVLHVQNPFADRAGITQNAVFLRQEEASPWYIPPVPVNDVPTNFPIHSTADSPAQVPEEFENLSKIVSMTPQSIILNANFGNPWYVLEIQETGDGNPYFALVATYSYQLLLSSLKCPSQLGIRTSEEVEEEQTICGLYERHSLAYHVEKLGKLTRVGYLGEEDVRDNSRRVFIKMLDVDDETGKREEFADRDMALDLMRQADNIYNEITLLDKIPLHPYIMSPIGYVTLGSEEEGDKDGDKVVGYISDYYKNGRLSDYLFLPSLPGMPRVARKIKLIQKAKWAYQIVSAVKHLQRMAQKSLGDGERGFGLERFMIDEYLQLHLIGFGDDEKVSRLSWRVPPEARIRGEWDVTVERSGAKNKVEWNKLIWKRNNYVRLMFEKENLAELKDIKDFDPPLCSTINSVPGNICNRSRREDSNTDGDGASAEDIRKGINRRKQYFKDWSAFKEWRAIPGALEMVETYSVGIMLWLLFEQVPPETMKYGEDIPITWTESEIWTQCGPIPLKWREIVEACVRVNPSDRVGLDEVLSTFVKEVGKRWDVGWAMG